jgi:hypothetical protein
MSEVRVHDCLYDFCDRRKPECERCDAIKEILRQARSLAASIEATPSDAHGNEICGPEAVKPKDDPPDEMSKLLSDPSEIPDGR